MADSILGKYLSEVEEGLKNASATTSTGAETDIDSFIQCWVERSEETRKNRGLFFFCGNGASATIAEHLSHDCFQNADFLTETVSETSHITAIANDYSYEDVFSYRIGKVLTEKDMLITISSSGNSANIIKAIKTAKERGAYVVTLSGMRKDNKSRRLGDLNIYVPLDTYGLVETAHALIMHMWLDTYLERYKGGRH